MNVDFSIKGHHHHHPLQLHEDACLRGNDNELPEGFELTLIAILKLCFKRGLHNICITIGSSDFVREAIKLRKM